ncbi:MAG: substrate-binding domain-containing protein, partial [Pleurocapsa sp.]
MLNKQPLSIITLAFLLALVGIPKPAIASLLAESNSNSTSFPAADSIPAETKIRITGSNSTIGIAKSLKESFEQQYPTAAIALELQETSQTLQTLTNGQADLATIGRSLTAEEKAAGFVAIPFSREKIAIIINKNNTFNGDLSIDLFAKIFKGEITDWSELGGTPGKIELVDFPDTNDTREAFPNYSVFQTGELKTGANVIKLERDDINDAIAKLGRNGVSYTIADNAINRDDVKTVTMYQTKPDDTRYPFSQPIAFVYQGTPSKAVQSFLGFVTNSPQARQIIRSRIGYTPIGTDTATAPNGVNGVDTATAPNGVNGVDTATAPNGVNGIDTATAPNGVNGVDTATAPNGVNGVDTATAPNTTDENTIADGTNRKWPWWWWLPLLSIIPLGLLLFGGKSKSDREPAIDNYPEPLEPNGTKSLSKSNTLDDGLLSSDLDRTTSKEVETTSKMGGAAIAAGGAATVSHLLGKTKEQTNDDLNTSVGEFTEQATILQTSEPTIIQPEPVEEFTEQATTIQTDDIADDATVTNLSGAAITGGIAAGASNLLEDTTDEEIEAELTDISTDIPVENYTEQATKL